MNIASCLLPKAEVAYLKDNMTIRQGIEKIRRSGFSAVPVIDSENRYVGVVSEGDFLWNILEHKDTLDDIARKSLETMMIRDIIRYDKIKPVYIDTDMEQLLGQAQRQNFVPVIDDRGIFIGIITRSEIIRYFIKKQIEMFAME